MHKTIPSFVDFEARSSKMFSNVHQTEYDFKHNQLQPAILTTHIQSIAKMENNILKISDNGRKIKITPLTETSLSPVGLLPFTRNYKKNNIIDTKQLQTYPHY